MVQEGLAKSLHRSCPRSQSKTTSPLSPRRASLPSLTRTEETRSCSSVPGFEDPVPIRVWRRGERGATSFDVNTLDDVTPLFSPLPISLCSGCCLSSFSWPSDNRFDLCAPVAVVHSAQPWLASSCLLMPSRASTSTLEAYDIPIPPESHGQSLLNSIRRARHLNGVPS